MEFIEQLEDDEAITKRKKQILLIVESYYNRFKFLQTESCENFVKKVFDLYLDSDLTINEIDEEILRLVKSNKKINNDDIYSNRDSSTNEKANKIVVEKEAMANKELDDKLDKNNNYINKLLLVGIILLFIGIIFLISK